MDRRSWSDLPKELLFFIATLLETHIDIIRLRSVCTSWRSSIPLHHNKSSPLLPLRLPVWISPGDLINKTLPGFFSLTESTTYRLQPVNKASSSSCSNSMGWLIKIEETEAGKMRLLPLLCSSQHLPATFPDVLNLQDFHISVITKAYRMKYVFPVGITVFQMGDFYSLDADKVVLSSSHRDYAIMATHSAGKLGLLNSGDEKWGVIDGPPYEDIINYRGQFCAVDITGRAISIDFSAEKSSQIALPLPDRGGSRKHLVESCGDLILVDRYYADIIDEYFQIVTAGFSVFKLNKQRQEWVEIKTLGDQVLFIGDDSCFSVSARDFAGSKGNCIYFRELYYAKYNKKDNTLTGLACDSTGVFNLENGSLGPLAAYPGYSNIFWPPPSLVAA